MDTQTSPTRFLELQHARIERAVAVSRLGLLLICMACLSSMASCGALQ